VRERRERGGTMVL
jgi:hypothetical protein